MYISMRIFMHLVSQVNVCILGSVCMCVCACGKERACVRVSERAFVLMLPRLGFSLDGSVYMKVDSARVESRGVRRA